MHEKLRKRYESDQLPQIRGRVDDIPNLVAEKIIGLAPFKIDVTASPPGFIYSGCRSHMWEDEHDRLRYVVSCQAMTTGLVMFDYETRTWFGNNEYQSDMTDKLCARIDQWVPNNEFRSLCNKGLTKWALERVSQTYGGADQ